MSKKLRSVIVVVSTLLTFNTYAAVDMFLLLQGIKGEAQDKAYKDSIDILAWSWNLSQSGTTHMGSGGGAGRASFADISLTKYIDSSSVSLYEHIATGKHIDSAAVKLRKPGDRQQFNFEEYVMYDVLVTSASLGGSGGEDRLTENISLNFRSFCIRYVEQTEDGSAGRKSEVCWNIAGGESCTVAQLQPLMAMPIAQSLPMGQLLRMNPICLNT